MPRQYPSLISAVVFFWLAAISISGCGLFQRGAEDKDILYLAIGASDAIGIGATPLKNGYVFRIREALEQQTRRDVRLVNLAIPGGSTRELRQTLQLALRREIKPNLVTIWTGANDILNGQHPEDFEKELTRLLTELRDKTSSLIVIADIPDLTRSPRFRSQPSPVVTVSRIGAFNRVIAQQADAFNVPLVRLSREEVNDELVSDVDGFHPSDRGHRLIAELFLKVILPKLLS